MGTVLPLDWGYPGGTDSTFARYAPVALTSGYDPTLPGTYLNNPTPIRDGYLTQGAANGQLYAYSVGTGAGGVGETVGP